MTTEPRPNIKCTSCNGDGHLHYESSCFGGPAQHRIDTEEPCWTCGGKGYITPDMVNINGDSLYEIVLAAMEARDD